MQAWGVLKIMMSSMWGWEVRLQPLYHLSSNPAPPPRSEREVQ